MVLRLRLIRLLRVSQLTHHGSGRSKATSAEFEGICRCCIVPLAIQALRELQPWLKFQIVNFRNLVCFNPQVIQRLPLGGMAKRLHQQRNGSAPLLALPVAPGFP